VLVDLLTEYSNRPNVLADLCATQTKLSALSTRATTKRTSVRSERSQHDEDGSPADSGYDFPKRVTSTEVDELVDAYRTGVGVNELARRYDLHRHTVAKRLQARGIDTNAPKISPHDIRRAADLYREGWSLARLGERFGIDDGTMRSRLLEVGVVMRARRGGKRKSAG